jgi:hypothetical protein
VPEKLLNGANIITIFKEMRSKTVAKRMTASRLRQAGASDRVANGVLQVAFGDMMPAFFTAARIEGEFFGWKDVLPGPLPSSLGIFSMQSAGEVNRTAAASEILLMKFFHAGGRGWAALGERSLVGGKGREASPRRESETWPRDSSNYMR